jgi:succinate-acetate transporter protein
MGLWVLTIERRGRERKSNMDLSSVNKHSSRNMAILTVCCSGFGGEQIERGIQQLIHARLQYDWTSSFLLGSAFLCYGTFWAVMLVRRTGAAHT